MGHRVSNIVPEDLHFAFFEAVRKVRQTYPDFKYPVLMVFRNRAAAGIASPRAWAIRINLDFWERERQNMEQDTLPHELCHLIVSQYFRKNFPKPRPHGMEWRQAMRHVFGIRDPQRAHQYSTEGLGIRRQRRYLFGCGCDGLVHQVSAARYNKMLLGRQKYQCKQCKSPIRPVGDGIEIQV